MAQIPSLIRRPVSSPQGKKPPLKRQTVQEEGHEDIDRSTWQYILASEFVALRKSMGGISAKARQFLAHAKHRRVQLVDHLGFVMDEGGKGVWTHNYQV